MAMNTAPKDKQVQNPQTNNGNASASDAQAGNTSAENGQERRDIPIGDLVQRYPGIPKENLRAWFSKNDALPTEYAIKDDRDLVTEHLQYWFSQKEKLMYSDKIVASVVSFLRQPRGVKTFMLTGSGGVGKTVMTKALYNYFNAKAASQGYKTEYVVQSCNDSTSAEDLTYKIMPDQRGVITRVDGPVLEALRASWYGPVVLLIDEYDKTRAKVDGMMLDILQNARVANRLSNDETMVYGNPENLVIIFTSNAEREYSDVFDRRVKRLELPRLSEEQVLVLLTDKNGVYRFKPDLARLLGQIYIDSQNSGLNKPATIQELGELGEAIKMGQNIPLSDLIHEYVIKNDEDFAQFDKYAKDRKSAGAVKYDSPNVKLGGAYGEDDALAGLADGSGDNGMASSGFNQTDKAQTQESSNSQRSRRRKGLGILGIDNDKEPNESSFLQKEPEAAAQETNKTPSSSTKQDNTDSDAAAQNAASAGTRSAMDSQQQTQKSLTEQLAQMSPDEREQLQNQLKRLFPQALGGGAATQNAEEKATKSSKEMQDDTTEHAAMGSEEAAEDKDATNDVMKSLGLDGGDAKETRTMPIPQQTPSENNNGNGINVGVSGIPRGIWGPQPTKHNTSTGKQVPVAPKPIPAQPAPVPQVRAPMQQAQTPVDGTAAPVQNQQTGQKQIESKAPDNGAIVPGVDVLQIPPMPNPQQREQQPAAIPAQEEQQMSSNMPIPEQINGTAHASGATVQGTDVSPIPKMAEPVPDKQIDTMDIRATQSSVAPMPVPEQTQKTEEISNTNVDAEGQDEEDERMQFYPAHVPADDLHVGALVGIFHPAPGKSSLKQEGLYWVNQQTNTVDVKPLTYDDMVLMMRDGASKQRTIDLVDGAELLVILDKIDIDRRAFEEFCTANGRILNYNNKNISVEIDGWGIDPTAQMKQTPPFTAEIGLLSNGTGGIDSNQTIEIILKFDKNRGEAGLKFVDMIDKLLECQKEYVDIRNGNLAGIKGIKSISDQLSKNRKKLGMLERRKLQDKIDGLVEDARSEAEERLSKMQLPLRDVSPGRFEFKIRIESGGNILIWETLKIPASIATGAVPAAKLLRTENR